MEFIRNLGRRKLRSFLTITGIVIGILALTTMGAMANDFNALLDGGARYFADHVSVSDDTGSGVAGLVSVDKVAQIEAVDGVAAAFPSVSVNAKPGVVNAVNLQVPDTIYSSVPAQRRYTTFGTALASGHAISDVERGQVVLGSSFAAEFGKKVGESIRLPVRPADANADFVNHPFTVVGILARTQTAPDTGAYVGLEDAQMLLLESLPAAIRGSVDRAQLATSIAVYGRPGVDLDRLADRISAEVPGVKAIRPSALIRSFRAGGAIFTAITTGAALLALVIGGLSVINTMLMSVAERTREIGLKKAVGASTAAILREYITEAAVIGLIGGVLGFGMGSGIALLLDALTPPSQPALFLLTPGLAALSIGFASTLGAVAGVLPALRAARLDPVVALRSQS